MRIVALKLAGDNSPAAVKIPASGDNGVDIGLIARALGLDPCTVKLNGRFISRGEDFVSKLEWESLLSFFASRGLPVGSSLLDSIVVEGKLVGDRGWHSSFDIDHVGHIGLKRKVTIEDEKSCKKNRSLEGYFNEQNIGSKQLTDDKCLCIKRQLKLVDDYPSKKGKIGDCNLDCQSSSNKENVDLPCLKREGSIDDENFPKRNQLLKVSATDLNFGTEQDADETDFLCMKRRLKLDDDHPTKKGKIGEFNSEKTRLKNCSFINVFGKPLREDKMAVSVFCERIK